MAATMSDSIEHTAADPSQQDDQNHHFGLNEMQMKRFGSVLRAMDVEAVPKYVSSVRQLGHHSTGNMPSKYFRELGSVPCSVPCKVVNSPLCGSYHVVFNVEFDDGVKWILKVSANGHRFDSVASAALTSEARTMQLLKTETTIPIPAVYAFDPSSRNQLNVRFILMERIEGQPLYQRWFDNKIPKANLEHFRIKVLQSLAEAMAQLNKFTLDQGGALEFDDHGRPIGLRGAKVVDAVAIWNHGTAFENQSEADQDDTDSRKHPENGYQSQGSNEMVAKEDQKPNEGKEDKNGKSEHVKKDEEDNDNDILCEKGPFQDPQSAFLFNLDRPNAYSESSVFVKGCYKALRMFIDMAFSNFDDRGRRFVLTHPDFDVQNVLVAEDGRLCGLIDWDGVASVPREIGCAQYPLWLMHDWVPLEYEYDIRERRPEEGAGFEESSPAELASYRALYAHFMEKEIERRTGGPHQVTAFGTLPKQEAQLTRRSLVMRHLDLAASTPIFLTNILSHILTEIEIVTEPEWRDPDLDMDLDSDSGSSSRPTIDSIRDTNSSMKTVLKDGPESGSTDIVNDVWNGVPAATSSQYDCEGDATTEPLLLQGMTKVPDGLSQTRRLDLDNQPRLEQFRKKAQEAKIEGISSKGLDADGSSKPTHLGWGQKLVLFSCEVAEKSLRRIAKIGHVLKTAVEELAEMLAEVRPQCPDNPQLPNGRVPAVIEQQQPSEIEVGESPETEPSETTTSSPRASEPEQFSNRPQMQVAEELYEHISTQDMTGSDQPHGLALTQRVMNLNDVLARKAELVKARKAEKKAHYLADKAAIQKELNIWEDITLDVWAEGVTLEQLRMNQAKITSWVINTFQEKGEQDKELVADADCSPTALVEASNTKDLEEKPEDVPSTEEPVGSSVARSSTPMSEAGASFARRSRSRKQVGVRKAKKTSVAGKESKTSSGFRKEHPSPSSRSAQTGLILGLGLVRQSLIWPNNNPLAHKSIYQGETRQSDDKAFGATAVINQEPSLRFQPTLELKLQPERVADGFRALCSFGASCYRKIFSHRSSPEDDRGSVTSESGNSSIVDTEGESSETVENCESSATSLSNDEVGVGENAKAKDIELGEKSVAPTTETKMYVDENTDGGDDFAMSNALERMSSRNDPMLAASSSKHNDSPKYRLRRSVRNPRSGTSTELSKAVKTATYINVDQKGVLDSEGPAGCGKQSDALSTKNTGSALQENHRSNAFVDNEGGDDDLRTFKDDGEFRIGNIFNLLGMDMLDELRLLRMQEGFLKLLERY